LPIARESALLVLPYSQSRFAVLTRMKPGSPRRVADGLILRNETWKYFTVLPSMRAVSN
jgi:hypothetical protein